MAVLAVRLGHDIVMGGENNDYIFGGFGDDTLNGDNGDDSIFGEIGEDDCDFIDGNNDDNGFSSMPKNCKR